MIVTGGGISLDGQRWISARPAFLLPVRVLGALFRRLFLTRLLALYEGGQLGFFGGMTHLAERRAFLRHLSPSRTAGSSASTMPVTFRYKDYRRNGAARQQVMTLTTDEFIRRFLLHDLPKGFHRIREYGLLASSTRWDTLERTRQLVAVAAPVANDAPVEPPETRPPCPCCGEHMVVMETLQRRYQPRAPPAPFAPSGRQAL